MTNAPCARCGHDVDPLDQHVRFRLPDPVLRTRRQERTRGTWMSGDDPDSSVMLQVPRVGPFVRVLLPVHLTGGGTLTFGTWLCVHPDDLRRAFEQWWAPSYPDLVLDGVLANDVGPWSLVGTPARATVLDVDHTPTVTSSADPLLARVLTEPWAHDAVLHPDDR